MVGIRSYSGRAFSKAESLVLLKVVVISRADGCSDVERAVGHRRVVLVAWLDLRVRKRDDSQPAHGEGKEFFHVSGVKGGTRTGKKIVPEARRSSSIFSNALPVRITDSNQVSACRKLLPVYRDSPSK